MNVSIDFEIHTRDPKQAAGVAYSRALNEFSPQAGETVEIRLFDGRQKYGSDWYFDVTATWIPKAEF